MCALEGGGGHQQKCDLRLFTPPHKRATVHLVDVWNMIEAFRDNGLNTLDHNSEINVSRLETILSSIYYQLNKRLPTTHQINVEQSIGLLLNFMVATYDRYSYTPEQRATCHRTEVAF